MSSESIIRQLLRLVFLTSGILERDAQRSESEGEDEGVDDMTTLTRLNSCLRVNSDTSSQAPVSHRRVSFSCVPTSPFSTDDSDESVLSPCETQLSGSSREGSGSGSGEGEGSGEGSGSTITVVPAKQHRYLTLVRKPHTVRVS